jgi:L-2-hydroxyglutarate oxidase LhgO
MCAKPTDFLMIGGGIIGVTLSRELASKFPGASVTLVEKEPQVGTHASGRNSGVLHAGILLLAYSLKARFTRPAFWREQYDGIANFSAKELVEVLWREATIHSQ